MTSADQETLAQRVGDWSGLRDLRVDERAPAIAVLLVSAAVGIALVVDPVLALLPIAALAGASLLVSARARIVFILFGGIVIFQQGEGVSLLKMAFLGLFSIAFVGSFLNARRLWDTAPYRSARPLLAASTGLGGLAALSLAVAYNNGIPLAGVWLRDIAPYLLFAAAPIFALEAQASFSRRGLVALLVCAGVLGAFAFAAEWFGRRSIADFQEFGLASHFVPAALFAYGMSATLQAGKTKWLALSGLILALLLATGTRTTLVLVLAPLAIVVGARRGLALRSLRFAVLGPIAVGLTIILILGVLRVFNANEDYFYERIALSSSSGTASDDSYVERVNQAWAAWAVFESNPIVGSGPGTTFEWQTSQGDEWSGYVLDNSVGLAAKFGVLGLVVFAFVISRYWSFSRALMRRRDPTVAQLAFFAYLVVAAGTAFFYTPFEDKGLAFGLIFVLALVLQEEGRPPGAIGPSRPEVYDSRHIATPPRPRSRN